jgi:hypothetical protein
LDDGTVLKGPLAAIDYLTRFFFPQWMGTLAEEEAQVISVLMDQVPFMLLFLFSALF